MSLPDVFLKFLMCEFSGNIHNEDKWEGLLKSSPLIRKSQIKKKKKDLSLFPKRKTLKIAEALKFKFII